MLFRSDGNSLKLVAGIGTGPPAPTSGIAIDTSGNVGIGTTFLTARLSVQGPDTSAGTAVFQAKNSDGNPGLIVFDDRTVQIGALYFSSAMHACINAVLHFAACMSAAEYVPSIDNSSGFPETADLVSIASAVTNPYGDTHSPLDRKSVV